MKNCPMYDDGRDICMAKNGFADQRCLHLLTTRCRMLPDDIDCDLPMNDYDDDEYRAADYSYGK